MARMSDNPTAADREAVARLVARFFLMHLLAEVVKPDEVLLEDYPDLPVRDMTRAMIADVRREFDFAEDEEMPPYNLFERWCNANGMFRYEDAAFVAFNRTALQRVLDLRDGTEESRERQYATMRETFSSFDYEKQGFTVAFFLDSEGNMRELLREAVREFLPELEGRGDALILAQSRAYQRAMHHYFEGVLKTTLAENVRLLHGILPQQVATELKKTGFVRPVHFEEAVVLFTDFEGFSRATEQLAPGEVIRRLDIYFTEFDRICAEHGLEKIKTIGDSYMAVAGVPEPRENFIRAACDAALAMNAASEQISREQGNGWRIRIGLHVGPLVAGVIGRQKFSYDVWGATVNLASRMESSGEPGRVNVSAEVHARVGPHYRWEHRGPQPVKRLGLAEMYFLEGPVEAQATVNG
jgi:class 3 adenylate cyclase